MPRPALGPRLYLRQRKDAEPTWAIRHGQRFISTRLPKENKSEAEAILQKYRNDAGWTAPAPIHSIPLRRFSPETIHTIYFISCKMPDFPIKLGYANDLATRLSSIQTALPFKVIVLADMPGTKDDERDLKIYFRQSRIRGEWFRRSPEIMEYIARILDVNKDLQYFSRDREIIVS